MDQRIILHADLDAFFASVEQRDDPTLRGKPVLVGGSTQRGVVAAASYEARRFGIHSAMPMAEAMRRCPHAVVVSHNMERYLSASQSFFAILDDYSPLVEPLSVDEAFLDLTGTRRLLGPPPDVARQIKQRVTAELGLVVSIGLAPTKFVAKIASDIDKPDGLRIISPDQLQPFLRPLPATRLWGVGSVTRDRLTELGLHTIGQIADFSPEVLARHLGDATAAHLGALARGEDPREVDIDRATVSIGHEETFETDCADKEQIRTLLLDQADRVSARLRHAESRARTVTLKIKFADFRLVTRRRTLTDSTSDGNVIGQVANQLLDLLAIDDDHGRRHRIRLCGIAVSGLEPRHAPRQLTLDEDRRARGERLGDTLDEINRRFGSDLIGRAACRRRRDPDES